MDQQLPSFQRFPDGGISNSGNITIEAPILGDLVQIGHGNLALFQLKVLGVQDATLRLNPQDPTLHMLMQMVADGKAQSNQLAAGGIKPDVVPPARRDGDAPFASPFGVPVPLSGDASQLVQGLASFNELLQQLDQRFGGPLASLSDEQQSVNLSNVLLQKGNLALWRFRQGALCLFAEQASLYLLAEPQDPAQPLLVAFQTAARTNLEVLRGWVLFQKYRISIPTLIDSQAVAALSEGQWQVVLDDWSAGQRLSSEQARAERSYLNALGDHYDAQAVQSAVHEAEWYFREALRRQPNQSAALVNLAALLAESALLSYIETGNLDRALAASPDFLPASACFSRPALRS